MQSATRARDTGLHRARHAFVAAVLALGLTAHWDPASAADRIRLALLEYGTANWELDTIRRHGLDKAEALELDVKQYAGPQATLVALQSGDTDLAIEDWIWVARQRAEGRTFAFVPYSTATGALVAPKGSGIATLADLKGKRLGIAGGPLDKSWLILRALSIKQGIGDLESAVQPVYGAPPLVGEQLKQGRVDGVLTYWHYAARLVAAGYEPVLEVSDARKALGVEANVPMIGYVFDSDWASRNRNALLRFLRAADRARTILQESDADWEAIRPRMKVPDEATFIALRDGYRAGIPRSWGPAERAGAERLFEILRGLGGERLTGSATRLPTGTFWDGLAEPESAGVGAGGKD
jgi:NitT/TauT family transport system substrate-binding protein